MEAANNVGEGGGKRKIDEAVEMVKQKVARFISQSQDSNSNSNSNDYSSSFSAPPSASSYPVSTYAPQNNGGSKTIKVPNGKVGVIIGRGGDVIKNLQLRSGARIQITRDAHSDPSSLTRDVELVGSSDQIHRAEDLINDLIAQTDAASSGPSGGRGSAPDAQQFTIKVPNDKVALVIGKGGETIKAMQSQSGARIQVVPLHLPPGDTSTERNVYINGTQEQIESAKELVNEVISGNRLKVMSRTNTYTQPGYPPSAAWAPQGQPPAYGYAQPGAFGYAQPPPSYYGGCPPQPTAWDPLSNTATPPQQQITGYNTYGQQAPPTSTPPNVGYNYGQVPPAAGYSYNQGYAQQPTSYGQDVSGQAQTQAPDQATLYSNPAYVPPAASSQPDASAAAQVSQPGYAASAVPGQPDGTTQPQPPSAYATGYSQPTAAPANGYAAYQSYSSAPPAQPIYSQTGYPSQTGYGEQQVGQVGNQASYGYYGQSGYPTQASYYQGAYPAIPPQQVPPQTQPQATNGISEAPNNSGERTGGGDSTTGSAAAAVFKAQY